LFVKLERHILDVPIPPWLPARNCWRDHQHRDNWKILRSSFYHKPILQIAGCLFYKRLPLTAAAVVLSDLTLQPTVSSRDSPRGQPAEIGGNDNNNE